jgi:ketosteroid isomerase-like protein
MPATNKKLGMMVFHGVAFNDANLVTDEWWVMDGSTFAGQMGMSTMPSRPAMDKGADAPTIVVATGSDTEKANLAAATKGNDDFNKHDLAAIMAGWADDGVESDQGAPADTTGKADIEKGTKMFLGMFSDGKVTPVITFAAGDYVFQASTFVGTNDGDMGPGMPKTGKSVKMTVVEFSKFDAGKVKQIWRFYDSSSMMKQLMPDMPPAPPANAPAPAPAKTN